MDDIILGIGVVIGVVVAVAVQIYLFLRYQKKKFAKLENNLIKNAIPLIQKLDDLENKFQGNGGKEMNEDIKKLAKYLAGKIQESKEETIEKIEELIEVLTEKDSKTDEPAEVNKDSDDYDELEDYEGDRKVGFDDVVEEAEDKKKKKVKKG